VPLSNTYYLGHKSVDGRIYAKPQSVASARKSSLCKSRSTTRDNSRGRNDVMGSPHRTAQIKEFIAFSVIARWNVFRPQIEFHLECIAAARCDPAWASLNCLPPTARLALPNRWSTISSPIVLTGFLCFRITSPGWSATCKSRLNHYQGTGDPTPAWRAALH
jgi:hypothetical protein